MYILSFIIIGSTGTEHLLVLPVDTFMCILVQKVKFKLMIYHGLQRRKIQDLCYIICIAIGEHWDLNKIDHRIPLSNHPIQCFCPVSNKLWVGVQKSFVILDMVKLHIEVPSITLPKCLINCNSTCRIAYVS